MNVPLLIAGQSVEVLWADLPLWLARRYTTDWGSWWDDTLPAFLEHYGMGIDDFWDLTVADHHRLAAHLGLIPKDDHAQRS
jgi:hypothetical protein